MDLVQRKVGGLKRAGNFFMGNIGMKTLCLISLNVILMMMEKEMEIDEDEVVKKAVYDSLGQQARLAIMKTNF